MMLYIFRSAWNQCFHNIRHTCYCLLVFFVVFRFRVTSHLMQPCASVVAVIWWFIPVLNRPLLDILLHYKASALLRNNIREIHMHNFWSIMAITSIQTSVVIAICPCIGINIDSWLTHMLTTGFMPMMNKWSTIRAVCVQESGNIWGLY